MNKRRIFLLSLLAGSVVLVCAQSWYPNGSKPLSGDREVQSLHKINQLLFGAITNNAININGNVTNTLSANVQVTNNVGVTNGGAFDVSVTNSCNIPVYTPLGTNLNVIGSITNGLNLNATNTIGVTQVLAQAVMFSTNLANANVDTPVVLATAGDFFRSITFIGRKHPRTNNADYVYIQNLSGNDTNCVPLAPASILTFVAPENRLFNGAQFYIDVATANDGVIAFWFN